MNNLKKLPESFGSLEIGGWLDLSNNNQLTSLPKSFVNIKIGSILKLPRNQLSELPENFEIKSLDNFSIFMEMKKT